MTSLVRTYYIAGCNIQTAETIEYNMFEWFIHTFTERGDSLVPEWSATLGDKYSSKTFFTKETNHMKLIADREIISFTIQLIDGDISVAPFENIFREYSETEDGEE